MRQEPGLENPGYGLDLQGGSCLENHLFALKKKYISTPLEFLIYPYKFERRKYDFASYIFS
jgi:hypothetical protein